MRQRGTGHGHGWDQRRNIFAETLALPHPLPAHHPVVQDQPARALLQVREQLRHRLVTLLLCPRAHLCIRRAEVLLERLQDRNVCPHLCRSGVRVVVKPRADHLCPRVPHIVPPRLRRVRRRRPRGHEPMPYNRDSLVSGCTFSCAGQWAECQCHVHSDGARNTIPARPQPSF